MYPIATMIWQTCKDVKTSMWHEALYYFMLGLPGQLQALLVMMMGHRVPRWEGSQ